MKNILYKKSCLKLLDYSYKEILYLLKITKILKRNKKLKKEIKNLKNKKIILMFEKKSTRTRCSFESAIFDQGANCTFLSTKDIHLNKKESIKDTAKVLGNIYDGIQFRGYKQSSVEKLAKYSKVPVWNGLTNECHPTQILSDLFTIKEIFKNKSFKDIKLSYVGDLNNNICNTLIEAAYLTKLKLMLIGPKLKYIKKKIEELKYPKNIKYTKNIKLGLFKSDIIYTDIWISMGEDKSFQEKKINFLKKYQINSKILKFTNNPNIKVFHCLPALHDKNTTFGKKIIKKFNLKNGVEITNTIFKKNEKIIFSQAENKFHMIKALLITSLKKNIFF
ncbi:ornithine carbamoyltransferase [Buchnera aphidicola]|uniref:ornithine carbamoyltransferase n=1 Tax=Buchnera aphidicola TaxID=9 RepID=UPI0030EC987D